MSHRNAHKKRTHARQHPREQLLTVVLQQLDAIQVKIKKKQVKSFRTLKSPQEMEWGEC